MRPRFRKRECLPRIEILSAIGFTAPFGPDGAASDAWSVRGFAQGESYQPRV